MIINERIKKVGIKSPFKCNCLHRHRERGIFCLLRRSIKSLLALITIREVPFKCLLILSPVFFSAFNITCCYASNCSAVNVGATYGGGTVFCVSNTSDTSSCTTMGAGSYGLFMANQDQVNYNSNSNHGITWSSVSFQTNATSNINGAANTAIIITASPSDNQNNNAAWACHLYTGGGHTDWYLPSQNELNNMYLYANATNLIGDSCSGNKTGGVQCLVGGYSPSTNNYWSSTESSGASYDDAWSKRFSNGNQGGYSKVLGYFGVRAVRAFNNPSIQAVNSLTNINKSEYENNAIGFTIADFDSSFSSTCGTRLAKIRIASLPSHGILRLSESSVTTNEEIPVNNLNDLTYTPNPGYIGSDSFDWNGSDGTLYATTAASVNITINDQAPTLTTFSKSVFENEIMPFGASDFTANFSGYNGHSLANIQIITLPVHGILKLSDTPVTTSQVIATADINDLTYAPDNGYLGSDSFTWNGSDGILYAISVASVNIAINDQAPTLTNVSKSVFENEVMTFEPADFTANFSGYQGNSLVNIQIVTLPVHGILKLSDAPVTTNQVIAAADINDLTYAPDNSYLGSDSFTWNGSDGTMYAISAANVSITVNDQAPTLTNFSKSVFENEVMTFEPADFTANFSGYKGNSLVNIQVVTLPAHGILKLSGSSVTTNQVIAAADINDLTYTPASSYIGSDSFTWNGSDGTMYAISAANTNISILALVSPNHQNIGAIVGGVIGGGAGAAAIGAGIAGGVYYYRHYVRLPSSRGSVELGIPHGR